jgi:hypothetical protein
MTSTDSQYVVIYMMILQSMRYMCLSLFVNERSHFLPVWHSTSISRLKTIVLNMIDERSMARTYARAFIELSVDDCVAVFKRASHILYSIMIAIVVSCIYRVMSSNYLSTIRCLTCRTISSIDSRHVSWSCRRFTCLDRTFRRMLQMSCSTK